MRQQHCSTMRAHAATPLQLHTHGRPGAPIRRSAVVASARPPPASAAGSASAASAAGTPASAAPSGAAEALLCATRDQRYGAASSAQQKQQLLDLVTSLKASAQQRPAAAAVAPTDGPLQGDWRLLWTSEASVHGIVRGQLLGAPVTDIQQRIDLRSKRVTNTISFGWLSLQLQAGGPLTVLSSSRIYYSFDALLLRLLGGLELRLPVVLKGGGWSDAVLLLDGEGGDWGLRVMENSRRDTLVLQRVVGGGGGGSGGDAG